MYNNYLGGQGQGQGQQQPNNSNGGGNANANSNLFAMLAQQLGGVALQQPQQQQAQSQPQQQQQYHHQQQQQSQQQQQHQPNPNANVAALALLQQQLALFQQIQSATQALAAGQGLQLPQGLQGLQGQGQNQQQALNLLLAAAAQQQQQGQQPQTYQQQHQHQQQQQYPPASSSSSPSNTSPAAQVAALAQWTSSAPPAPSASSSTSSPPKKPHTATWNPTAAHKSTAAAPAYGAMAYPARDTLSQRQKRELAARQQEAQFRMASGAPAEEKERDREYRHGGQHQQPQHESHGGGNRDRDRFGRGGGSGGGTDQGRHPPVSPVAPWKQNQQQPARNFSPPPVGRAASPVRQAPPANAPAPGPAPASGSGWASLMTFNSAPPAPPAQPVSQPPPQQTQPAANKFGLPLAPSQRHQQQKQQQQQQQAYYQQQPAQKPTSALFAMFGGGGGDMRTTTTPNQMPAGTAPASYPNQAPLPTQAPHDDQRAVRGYKDLYGPNAGVGGGRAKPTFQCEPCEKTFPSASQLRAHLDTHVKCTQCTYQASQRAVKFHEMEAHGMHQEDGDHGEILLPAHIKLETPEQIAQWIADRKRRYPTDANIAAKSANQDARLARGELALTSSTSTSTSAPLCRFVRTNQSCPHAANCKFRHTLAPGELEADNAPGMYAGRGKRAPLLERLLEREMRLEHSHLLQCLRFMVNNRFFEFGVVWKSGLEDGPGARTWGAKPGDEGVAEVKVKKEKLVDEIDEMVFGGEAAGPSADEGKGRQVPDLDTLRKQLLEAEHEDAMFYSDEDEAEMGEQHDMDVDAADDEGVADASSLDLIASAGGVGKRQGGAEADVYADEGDDEYDRTPMVFVDDEDMEPETNGDQESSSSDDDGSSEDDDEDEPVQEIRRN